MWQFTVRRLLLATLCLGVGIAALMIDTREPYGILIASLAFAQTVFCFLDPRWRVAQSDRKLTALLVFLLTVFMLAAGIGFALAGR